MRGLATQVALEWKHKFGWPELWQGDWISFWSFLKSNMNLCSISIANLEIIFVGECWSATNAFFEWVVFVFGSRMVFFWFSIYDWFSLSWFLMLFGRVCVLPSAGFAAQTWLHTWFDRSLEYFIRPDLGSNQIFLFCDVRCLGWGCLHAMRPIISTERPLKLADVLHAISIFRGW